MATKEWKDMSKGEKIGGILGFVIIVIVVVAIGSAIFGSDSKSNEVSKTEQSVNTNLPEDQQLKQIAENTLSGNNNMDKPYIRKIDVTEQVDGGWGVFIDYSADDNLTTGGRKRGIETKMSELYIALYTSGKDVRQASVAAYFPLQDTYGNSSEGVVYKTVLTKSEADKVNFSADDTTLKATVLPGAWETTALNQEFKD